MGQRLQPSTLRVTVCAGIVLAVKLPPCDAGKLTPQEFPGGGYQYEAQQPPTYYAVTVPFRLFFFDVLGVSDPDATRLVGILWLVGGLLLLWAAARLLRLTPGVIGAAVLLIGAAPVVVYESAIVTNDAASILAAGLVLFFAALACAKARLVDGTDAARRCGRRHFLQDDGCPARCGGRRGAWHHRVEGSQAGDGTGADSRRIRALLVADRWGSFDRRCGLRRDMGGHLAKALPGQPEDLCSLRYPAHPSGQSGG